MTASTVVRSKGQITIPAGIRKAAHLAEGDPVEVEMVEEGILIRPQKVIDATQAWFWTPTWQAGEYEASQQIDAGAGDIYGSDEEFLASLDD